MKININPPTLTDYQRDILYCSARFTITEACTKAGKTFSHLWWIYERAHADWNKHGYNHWWVAPTYSQSKIAFNRMRAIVVSSGVYKINETALTITTPLGTIITFKTAKDPDNLYGEDVYSAVFDEAPRAKVESWHALRSTLTATGAPCKMIGNFGGVANWMHQLKQMALTDKEYRAFKITAVDAVRAGILSQEEIDQARKDYPPKVFASLYMAEAQESEDMLCSYDTIQDLWTNDHAETGTMYMTCDIALHGSDKFVIIIWDGWKIVHVEIIDKCEADEVTDVIKALANKFKVGRRNIVYDADGLGAFLRGYLKGAIPFNNNAAPIQPTKANKINYKNLKSQCGYELAATINKALIWIDCDAPKEKIIEELECLRSWDLDKDGKIQLMPKAEIKDLIGHSPDILDALLMRMIFKIKPKAKAPSRSRVI